MANWIVNLVIGVVVIFLGVLLIRGAAGVASFFYSLGESLYGEKIAKRTYTTRNTRIAGIGWIVVGSFGVVLGSLGLAGVIH